MTVNASLGRLMRFVATLIALLAAAVLAGCGSKDSSSKTAEIPSGGASPTTSPTAPEPASSGCKQVDAPAPKPDGGAKKPKAPLDPSTTWTLTFKTSCGDFTVKLDPKG